ncbi:protein NDRG3-like isoform X1 [Vespula maculifrons]|uniref:Protein NDRG3-like isoform X1 n=1 Tax=Vespula maculifrons TaxID=7453 RepID=A0ABD2AVI3_VESMC
MGRCRETARNRFDPVCTAQLKTRISLTSPWSKPCDRANSDRAVPTRTRFGSSVSFASSRSNGREIREGKEKLSWSSLSSSSPSLLSSTTISSFGHYLFEGAQGKLQLFFGNSRIQGREARRTRQRRHWQR